jgi:hypothetical protein
MPGAVAQQLDLPASVRGALGVRYQGWQLSSLYPDVAESLRARTAGGPLNLVRGDFDGNGEDDIAILVEYRRPQSSGDALVDVVAFLAKESHHEMLVIEGPDPHIGKQYIRAIPRGSRGYDLNTNTDFVYERDAIGVEFEGTGGHTWIYRNGRFVSVWTSD